MARAFGPGAASGPRGPSALLVICAVLVVAVAVLVTALVSRGSGSGPAQGAAAPTPSPSASKTPSVADIYQKIGPSVVVVRTSRGALGSGVIVADDGTVLTADHVIAAGGAITLLFADGTRSAATVASADAKSDVATLTPATPPGRWCRRPSAAAVRSAATSSRSATRSD